MSLRRSDPAPLAVRNPAIETWRDVEWQKLWLALQTRPWSSLAVVPAGVGAASDFTLTVAVTLAKIGIRHLGTPIQVADATAIPLVHLVQFSEELARLKQDGDRVLVAVAPLAENPITASIARTSDAAVLCVLMEEMAASDATDTVSRIGAERFIGSAVFHPGGVQGPKTEPSVGTPRR